MKLRFKIPLFIAAASLVLIALLYFVLGDIILKSYSVLEADLAVQNVERIKKAILSEEKRITSAAGDYAFWDDTYQFVVDKNNSYIEMNFDYSSVTNLKLDLFCIVNSRGELINGKIIVDSLEDLRDLDTAEVSAILQNPGLWKMDDTTCGKSGIVMLNKRPLIVGAGSILKTDRSGPSKGAVVFAKYLDEQNIEILGELTGLVFSINAVFNSAKYGGKSTVVSVVSPDSLSASSLVSSIRGEQLFEINLPIYRSIIAEARKQINFFLTLLIILSIGFAIAVIMLLDKYVIRRLNILSRDIRIIRQRKRTDSRVTVRGRDELSELGGTINEMLGSIEMSGHDIAESEKKFRLAFENAKDPFFWISCEDFTITNVNKAAVDLLGISRNNLIGSFISSCFPENRVQDYIELFKIYAERSEPFNSELEIKSIDGNRIVEISGTTTILAGQKVIQTVFQDITKEREAEQEKHQLEEQLRQAQKMEVVGQLAGGIAHDFNNMLSGISGYSDLILKKYGNADPNLAKYAGIIHETAASAADVTAKLLAFARKGKNEVSKIDLNELVEDVIKLMEHSSDRKVTVMFKGRVDSATVVGDKSQIQNAILNLAMNSIDAMPSGGELTFVTEIIDIDEDYVKTHPYKITVGRYVKLVVQDNGTGMDSRVKARLFEPFFTTKGVGKGTGLGLASVYGTMKSHNGSISVYSELGQGTAFNLYFPSVANPDSDALGVIQKVVHGSGSILVIDDENVVRSAATDILTELGYSVETASDGLEGVRLYKESWQKFDLVILDIIMPKLNGSDTFNELKKINPEIKALICSGYAMNAVAAKILDSGAKAFIQKPFDVTKLSKAVADILSV